MIGIHTGIVIRHMAAFTSVGGIDIIPLVTGITIIRNRYMRPCKRINTVVIKRRGRPGGFTMAKRAIGGVLHGLVIGVGGAQIVGVMTSVAGIGRIVIISVVAGGAIIGYSCMRPV